MWTFERCVTADAAILAVQAPYPDPIGGFSWWSADDYLTIQEGSALAAKLLARAIEGAISHFDLKPTKTIAMGFSQGAAVIAVAFLDGIARFDGVALLAGFVPNRHHTKILGSPKVFMAHGVEDQTVRIDRARSGAEQLRTLGLEVTWVEDSVGHKVGIAGTRGLTAWARDLLTPNNP